MSMPFIRSVAVWNDTKESIAVTFCAEETCDEYAYFQQLGEKECAHLAKDFEAGNKYIKISKAWYDTYLKPYLKIESEYNMVVISKVNGKYELKVDNKLDWQKVCKKNYWRF